MTQHAQASSAASQPQPPVRLTSFSHGGGCGCKIAPGVLSQILAGSSERLPIPPELMVGIESSDDAAVYRLNDAQALIATTDFFMPIVDDPYDFGRIAATNALSDVYAMGGTPIMALALVGMPIDKLPMETVRGILAGGEAVCAAAGIPIAGGHTIDCVEPIYGLVALGLAHPDHIKRNRSARAGDVLILGKGLGVGIYSAALKKERLDAEGYAQLMASTTQLNTPGRRLAAWEDVHALTDVTGFGLLGHLLEMTRGAGLAAHIRLADVPCLRQANALLESSCVTGASGRNWNGYGAEVSLHSTLPHSAQALLTDPQTSGGLLVACAPEAAARVLQLFHEEGFAQAAMIGSLQAGTGVTVLP
jgi:selenide,water dikinase